MSNHIGAEAAKIFEDIRSCEHAVLKTMVAQLEFLRGRLDIHLATAKALQRAVENDEADNADNA